MRTWLTTSMAILTTALLLPSTIIAEDKEWTDLFAQDLRDWSRFGSGPNPWQLTTNRSLVCRGGKELFIPEREFSDGSLRFEYRFKPSGKKSGFKAGVWVRRTLEGSGCRIALGDDCGTMCATFQGGSDRVKMIEEKPPVKPARAIGGWNLVKIRLDGNSVWIQINGRQVASFNQCDSNRGLIALEVEQSEIEFRRVVWKDKD